MTQNDSYQIKVMDSGRDDYTRRLLVFTPTRGTVRMEWVSARYGQIIPVNWSMVMMQQFVSSLIPIRYTVADAQNLACKELVEKNYEWLLMIEDDTMPPPNALVKFNEYIQKGDIPVVSGLYFTKSDPSEPLIFRGRGTSTYNDWKIGDQVWADGVPTGMLLISGKLIKAMWKESPDYDVQGIKLRKIFHTPTNAWFDASEGSLMSETGTSDLRWCQDVVNGNFFKKAGFPKIQQKKYPFLVDTSIFCYHISPEGVQYPLQSTEQLYRSTSS